MLPIILVSKRKKDADDFLQKFVKENRIAKESIYTIFPLKKEILISQVREIKKELAIAVPFSRLFIFYAFDSATSEAQNALLKSLEESTVKNQFVLVTENEHSVLPTLNSRAKIIRLKDKNRLDVKFDVLNTNLLENIVRSTNYLFLSDKQLTGMQKDDAKSFIEMVIKYYRLKLANDPVFTKIIKKALYFRTLLESNNLNPQLTCDNLLIFINKAFKMKE